MSEKQNKMATTPVAKLLFKMGLPAVFSMLIQAMYNVVDSIYISNYSKDAMFAIGLANPLQMIGLSIALGGGVGASTIISRRLGQRKNEEANKIAANAFVLTILHILIVMSLGLFVSKPYLRIFTDRSDIVELGFKYLSIVLVACQGQQLSILMERIFQSQGEMTVPMIAQFIGAITNIILDPIMIFGKFGLPEMGIAGAAYATITGQFASMIFCATMLLIKKPQVSIRRKYMEISKERVKEIYQVGAPAMVMNMIGSVTTTAMNTILVRFTEDAVTALSIYFKLQSFVFMPIFGFNQGALPILSFSYGAEKADRYLGTVKVFLVVAETIMVCGTILFVLFPWIPLSMFDTDASLLETSEMVLRITGLSFVFVGPNIVTTTCLQSFGMGTTSMIQSILRQLGILIPLAWFLSQFGLNAVFYAYPIAEAIILLVFAPIVVKAYKKNFKLNKVA